MKIVCRWDGRENAAPPSDTANGFKQRPAANPFILSICNFTGVRSSNRLIFTKPSYWSKTHGNDNRLPRRFARGRPFWSLHGGNRPAAGRFGPSPFELFLSSLGTCAGIYVLGFCKQRNLPTAGIRIVEQINHSPLTGMVETIGLEIQVPAGFPEKYCAALIRSAEQCAVKKHLEKPPRFDITTKVV